MLQEDKMVSETPPQLCLINVNNSITACNPSAPEGGWRKRRPQKVNKSSRNRKQRGCQVCPDLAKREPPLSGTLCLRGLADNENNAL
ncbi:hypothetical protein J6590_053968 [Homalodisca vitripennis]|nr:hypothetical protein J6590_053968 [Homalodisca vitripennis]